MWDPVPGLTCCWRRCALPAPAPDHGLPHPFLPLAGDNVQPVIGSSVMKQAEESSVRRPGKAGTLLLDLSHACYSKAWFLVDKADQAKPGTFLLWSSLQGGKSVFRSLVRAYRRQKNRAV